MEGDVCSYHDILNMFKQTIAKYGRIDYAISNAAIYETYGFFDLALTIEDLEKVLPSSSYEIKHGLTR